MKLLYVLEHYHPHLGGVETVFKALCEGMVKKGHDVTVVTSQLPGMKKHEEINGVQVKRIWAPFLHRYCFPLFALAKVIHLARKHDVIHTTTFSAALPAWIASKVLRKPAVITVHEVWIGRWKQLTEKKGLSALVHDLIERFVHALGFHQHVCVSHATKEALLAHKKRPAKVIYNGIDYDHWNPKQYDGEKVRKELGLVNDYVYLAFGRPGISKGFPDLVKAFALVKKEVKKAKLVLILSKDPTYKKQYRSLLSLIRQCNVEKDVLILDPKPHTQLPHYLLTADSIVIPSRTEGFGFTTAESCALGKTIVVTDAGSLPEVISGKGKVVEAGNAESIAAGMIGVAQGEADDFGKKHFSWETSINDYEEVYQCM